MHTHTRYFSLLASCVLMVFALSAHADDTVKLDTSAVKTAAPVMYKDEKGDIRPLNAQDNKLTAVHFWATWCAPCAAELPQVDAAQAAYGATGFKVIAISLDDDNDVAKIKQFFAEHHIIHLAPNLDSGGASLKAFKVQGLPTTLFIDAHGKEIARAEGALDWKSGEVKGFIEGHVK